MKVGDTFLETTEITLFGVLLTAADSFLGLKIFRSSPALSKLTTLWLAFVRVYLYGLLYYSLVILICDLKLEFLGLSMVKFLRSCWLWRKVSFAREPSTTCFGTGGLREILLLLGVYAGIGAGSATVESFQSGLPRVDLSCATVLVIFLFFATTDFTFPYFDSAAPIFLEASRFFAWSRIFIRLYMR